MLYFQTAADDAAAFQVDWIYAIDAGSAAVEIYFTGTGESTLLSSVGLTVTAGQEENVIRAIVRAIGTSRDPLIVIADDENSNYVHSGITACGTITMDTTP